MFVCAFVHKIEVFGSDRAASFSKVSEKFDIEACTGHPS
jgi:hypothetical protein